MVVILLFCVYLAVSFPLAVVLGRRLRAQSPCCVTHELPQVPMVPTGQAGPAGPGQH